MIEIEQSEDYAFLDSVAKNDRVWPWVTCTTGDKNFDSSEMAGIFFVPIVNGKRAGFFFIYIRNPVQCELHTAILPDFWGKCAGDCFTAFREWIFSNTSIRSIITTVPHTNKAALRSALRNGFVRVGEMKSSFIKDETVCDSTLLETVKSCQ